MEKSVSAAHPAHSAVISRPGLYLVEGKSTREWLAIALLMLGREMELTNTFCLNGHWAHGGTFIFTFITAQLTNPRGMKGWTNLGAK